MWPTSSFPLRVDGARCARKRAAHLRRKCSRTIAADDSCRVGVARAIARAHSAFDRREAEWSLEAVRVQRDAFEAAEKAMAKMDSATRIARSRSSR